MPDFFDQAKKLAGEHSDLVDKGLDQAADETKDRTAGKYDAASTPARRSSKASWA